jgi:hydrogenase maturation protease
VAEDVLVIGVGNALRGDDAAGLELARRLRTERTVAVRELEGEGIDLLDVWEGADAVVIVDAVRSGRAPGVVHRIDASAAPLPARLQASTSSHAVGVADAIELARTLGRLPRRVVVLGVEGHRFDAGAPLSPEVSAALDEVARAVHREVRSLAGRDGP